MRRERERERERETSVKKESATKGFLEINRNREPELKTE